MSAEITMLVYSTALLLALVLTQAAVGVRAQGAVTMAGPRDNLAAPTMWQARTKRVVDNHREGLTIFAPLVLAAAVAHVSGPSTVLGAQLFFWSRLVHAGLYLAGVPLVRPVAWFGSVAGTVMVLAALLGLAH